MSIKIVVQRAGAPAADNHVFNFTSPSAARSEQAAITDALRQAIEAVKTIRNAPQVATGASNGAAQSEAMAIAQAVSAGARATDAWLDDSRLKSDVELQRSLLNASPALRKIFEQALVEKPESISISQFSAQFWSTRLHLLRAHAVEKTQSQGAYNVLSEVKPKNVDGTTRLNLSKEQIQLIFKQHPLVKRVYDESVPKLSEMEFWARFFVSKLFKKLKGEKITEVDSVDPVLDKYLNYDESAENNIDPQGAHVPHFIDLEGNEQNHSQRQGNRPDWTMRPNTYDKVPILRVLNSMSEKMLAHAASIDGNLHDPIGMDEETYNEVQLRDLRHETRDNRIKLKVQDQQRFFSSEAASKQSTDRGSYSLESPESVLAGLQQQLSANMHRTDGGGFNLDGVISIQEDSDSEEEQDQAKLRVGSRSSLKAATEDVLGAIKEHRVYSDEMVSGGGSVNQGPVLGLSQTLFDSLIMTHSTTVEFLHYFWAVFHSGDPERASELQKLVETLDKSLDRMKAVSSTAEAERSKQLERMKKQLEEYEQRTGKRRKLDKASVKGGQMAVEQLTAPIVKAISTAVAQYRKAYDQQSAQAEIT